MCNEYTDAIFINKLSTLIDIATLDLARSILKNPSQARTFYTYLLSKHQQGQINKSKDLLARVKNVCHDNSISFTRYLFEESYAKCSRGKMKTFDFDNGLVDSVRQQLMCNNNYSSIIC